ncbi:MAG: hypothetical protein CO094_11040 [Anaerolineae bacterium CG_4_9_14_3_um_filter_57_17]|nr:class I SAM-dependent methyltransferase [bacterium]NCT20442.1 class I SAM-dependent methyltransferase [bacterium]OIO83964.1 MAG: hypothetical protein AUK01_10810 [Anaerolineae bacterium CG2_30_57_67]PJB65088.1 MAG: hypothetical protein CO094_11040 [Anaerolineae bacterium CG_4_9_14_3_um_filter_57_17]
MSDFSDFLEIQTRTAWGRTLAEFAEWCAPQAGTRALDVGCGPGLFPQLLTSRYRVQAIGLDADFGLLRSAPAKFSATQADANFLPFSPAAFDFVTAANLIFLLADPRQALMEVYRVLRPGGALMLLNPSEKLTVSAALALADTRGLAGKSRASLLGWAHNAEKYGGWSAEVAYNLHMSCGFELSETILRVGPGFARLTRARKPLL